jgi:hypothetical protein
MKPDFSALIEQHEQSLDQELAQMKKGSKQHLSKKKSLKRTFKTPQPIPSENLLKTGPNRPTRLPKLEYMLIRARPHTSKSELRTTLSKIVTPEFHGNLMHGKPGAFADLIRFLGDERESFLTVGLKNFYLKFLKKFPMTETQKGEIRQLIWNYAHNSSKHRSRIYGRLAIKVSSPDFHLDFVETAERSDPKSNWKIHLIRQYLDQHSIETRPL